MALFTYEIHRMDSPLLPFIFLPSLEVKSRQTAPNWHENMEMLYCCEGAGTVSMGGEPVPFEKGDLVAVNREVPHWIGSRDRVCYCCLIVKDSFLRENGLDPTSVFFQKRIRDENVASAMEEVRAAFGAFDSAAPFGAMHIRSAVLHLYCLLTDGFALPREAEPEVGEMVRTVLRYVSAHFSEKVSLDQLAVMAGVSKFHLSRVFKRDTGTSPMRMVILLRLAAAHDQILRGERVSTAARSCGFDNLSYFTRSFRERYGCLPSDLGKKK